MLVIIPSRRGEGNAPRGGPGRCARHPGSVVLRTMNVTLLLLLLAMIALAIWTLRRNAAARRWWPGMDHSETVVIVGIGLLLPLTAWHVWSVRRVPARIAAFVSPYPAAYDAMDGTGPLAVGPMVYALEGDTVRARAALAELRDRKDETYLMRTLASPDSVVAFYREATHRPGWEILEDDRVLLILERGDERMIIGVADAGYGRGTTITYVLPLRRNAPLHQPRRASRVR